MSVLLALARKEFEDHLRNGWIVSLALAFAVFALVIALAGFGFAGSVGPAETEPTLVSLTSLVIYLIPLMGLLLGYDGIAGERERGTMDLLFSYPVSGAQLIGGKLLGLAAVLGATLLLGLAAPAALAVWNGGAVAPWLLFAALSIWLGAIFVALALWLSTLARQRGTVLGMALALWLLVVILFDLGLIGLLVATGGDLPAAVVQGLFHLNPAGLFRALNLELLLGDEALRAMGFGGQALAPWSLLLSLAAWSVLPVALGAFHLRRME